MVLCCVVGLRPIDRMWNLILQVECPPWGGLFKGSVFTRFLEQTAENSERLVRLSRSEIEPGTCRLRVLRAEQNRSATGGAYEFNDMHLPESYVSKLFSLFYFHYPTTVR